MKYILIAFLTLSVLNLKAQNISYDISLVQLPIEDSVSAVPYTKTKARQFRSVYKSIWDESLGIKIVSKPLNKKYKVKFKGKNSMYKYSGKYFIIDGVLTSYKLSAVSTSKFSDVKIFGMKADKLKIRLQYFQSGYIGTAEWVYAKANSYKNHKLSLLLPAIPDLQEFSGDGLLLILPDIKKVP